MKNWLSVLLFDCLLLSVVIFDAWNVVAHYFIIFLSLERIILCLLRCGVSLFIRNPVISQASAPSPLLDSGQRLNMRLWCQPSMARVKEKTVLQRFLKHCLSVSTTLFLSIPHNCGAHIPSPTLSLATRPRHNQDLPPSKCAASYCVCVRERERKCEPESAGSF